MPLEFVGIHAGCQACRVASLRSGTHCAEKAREIAGSACALQGSGVGGLAETRLQTGLGIGAAVLALAAVLATSVGGVLLVATGARAQGLPRDGRGRMAAEPGQPRAEVERIQQGLLLGLGGGAGLVVTGVVLFVLGVVSGGGAAVVLGLWRTME